MLTIVKVVITVTSLLYLGCATNSKMPTRSKATDSIRAYKINKANGDAIFVDASVYSKTLFVDNSKTMAPYLAMNVFYEPLINVREFIEKKEGVKLNHRGEAHITVVTPPEYELLKSVLSIELINEVALLNRIQESPFSIICLGRSKKIEDDVVQETYYFVIDSPKLVALRHAIAALFKARGGHSEEFKPDEFYPHVTVGYLGRDLHISDGAIKNKASCFIDVQLKAQ